MAEKRIENIDIDELKYFEKFMSVPMILFNETEVFYANASFHALCNAKGEAKAGRNIDLFTHDLRVLDFIRAAQHSDDQIKQDFDFKRDQTKCWIEMTGRTVHYRGYSAVLATLRDITKRKQLEEDLARVSMLRMLMLEVTQSVLDSEDIEQLFQLILDNALKALSNGSLGSIMTKERTDFTIASYVGFNEEIKDFRLPIEETFLYRATNGKMDRIVNIPDLMTLDKYYLYRTVFGEEQYIKSTITGPIYIKGSLFGIISIDSIDINAFDEDDMKSMEFIRNSIEIALGNHLSYQEKAFLARYDRLTGLYNRAYFEEQFAMVKDHALRFDHTFNLVMFDMNNLKRINDTYGHLTGDRAIQSVAHVLESNIRSSDFIARLGGDEFVGIFYRTDHAKLKEKFDIMLEKLSQDPLMIGTEDISCSFSYGIADFPDDGKTMNELLKIADDRMYSFKGHGHKEPQ
jgi:diguanylate cyclase (GGDEF)-like protein/PAS domain S-box-containing protein